MCWLLKRVKQQPTNRSMQVDLTKNATLAYLLTVVSSRSKALMSLKFWIRSTPLATKMKIMFCVVTVRGKAPSPALSPNRRRFCLTEVNQLISSSPASPFWSLISSWIRADKLHLCCNLWRLKRSKAGTRTTLISTSKTSPRIQMKWRSIINDSTSCYKTIVTTSWFTKDQNRHLASYRKTSSTWSTTQHPR